MSCHMLYYNMTSSSEVLVPSPWNLADICEHIYQQSTLKQEYLEIFMISESRS